ncbi:unnamed protein product [Symbiodinium sp. CCMP2456]|nr:unnamed protein product [Symbiodinium sp. CCMP2456]
MIQEAAAKTRNADQFGWAVFIGTLLGLPLILLVLCSAVQPQSAAVAAALAIATVPLCCCISVCSMGGRDGDETSRHLLGKYDINVRVGIRLGGLLALLSLVAMTAQHSLQGFWWTAFIVWPVAVCGGMWFLVEYCDSSRKLTDDAKNTLKREHQEARNRTLHFEGSVIRERGRKCVVSWPGKYEGAWESLVSQSRDGQVSAAVVFLPEFTEDYGKCDSIPLAEGLPGKCWCTPLYGEKKDWGCRWFSKWKENIEVAVASGAQLEVYFFQGQVGQGKVESFESAGEDNLRREKINEKQKDFEESAQFKQALDAGLGNLSKEPRGDGSSQKSREVRRLFLASLQEAEREFITASEGLGNSQKAEVAWLEKKGYEYWAVDVSTWLSGGQSFVPASAEQQPQLLGRQDDIFSV